MRAYLLLFIGLLLFTGMTMAQTPVYQASGIAIQGYDPVAYFQDNKPVSGKTEYSFEWNGATWLFANIEYLERFKQDPALHAPQYGGYCAFGASKGYLAPTDPQAFTILDGKLYLNYNLEVRAEWMKDVKERIQKADNHWEAKLKIKSK